MTDPQRIDLEEREARERMAYTRVASGYEQADRDLRLRPEDLGRVRRARTGCSDSLDQMLAWAQPLEGARVLEICCHDGEFGVILAAGGAQVTSIDLCPALIERARRRILVNGVADRMTAQVMSAHALEVPDESFDVVFGRASLHHLDLTACRREILRVLKPGGHAVFAEPVSLSPTLRAVRRLVPVPPARESPDERPLEPRDLEEFCKGFAKVELAHFRLASRLGRIVPDLFEPLARWDRQILDRFPALGRYAGICVFRVWKG